MLLKIKMIIIVLFTLWFLHHARQCSCKNQAEHPEKCHRTEFYGFQYGHLFLFTLLGAMYPDQFRLWIGLGVIWEVFEYWLSSRPDIVHKLGGCLTKSTKSTPLWFREVYGGVPKYENFIDRIFGIKNSQVHTWHYSIGENLTNILGFLAGRYLKNKLFV